MNQELNQRKKDLNFLIVEARNYSKAKEAASNLMKDYPDDTDILHSLASIHIALKEENDAIHLLNKVKQLEKDTATTYFFLGLAYNNLKDEKNIIRSFLDGAKKDPQNKAIAKYLNSYMLTYLDFKNVPHKEDIMIFYINTIEFNVLEIEDIKPVAQEFLIQEFDFIKNIDLKNLNIENIKNKIFTSINNKLLLQIIENTRISNQFLEELILKLYIAIITLLKTNNFSKVEELILINFFNALRKQNILKEVLWIKSNEELSIINEHKKEIINKIEKNKNLTDLEFLSFYKQFVNEEDQKADKIFDTYKKKNQAIAEEIEDISKMQKIDKKFDKKLSINKEIKNKNTIEVMEYYNLFPCYPWTKVKIDQKIAFENFLTNDLLPTKILGKREIFNKKDAFNVLDIGCGTGRDAILLSSIENSEIDALDVSRQNLKYALTKADEHNTKNINFMKLDFLDIKIMKKQYDFINCSFSLNEFEDVNKVFKMMKEILKPGGFIRLRINSELGNKNVELLKSKISSSKDVKKEKLKFWEDIKKQILLINDPQFEFIKKDNSLSSVSNLAHSLFPIRTKNFTIDEIINYISKNDLTFLGWSDFVNKEYKMSIFSNYQKEYPNDTNFKNLTNWKKLEIKHPIIFTNSYSFWLEKK